MRLRMSAIKRQEGSTLVIAIGAVSVMVIVGILVTVMAINTHKAVSHDKRQTEARNIAEAGIDDAIAVTLANYWTIYPHGAIPVGTPQEPDGPALFSSEQSIQDANGNTVGYYQVYTKQDPERPGNVLLTAKGSVDGTLDNPSAFVDVVRVSVKYTAKVFDYALLVGDFGSDPESKAEFKRDSDGSKGGGSITVNGKTHINGDLEVKSEGGGKGNITFNDKVTYTGEYNYSGSLPPQGYQPVKGDPVDFPIVDFDSSALSPRVTVTLSRSGGLPRGWSRNGDTFTITTADFQTFYGSGQIVDIRATTRNAKVEIVGAGTITSTIMTRASISKLELKGPDLNLRPQNGIAILSQAGKVEFKNGVNVGASGNGALIYCTGQNGDDSEFEVKNDSTIYGAILVKSNEEVEFKTGDDSQQGQNITINYDPSFVNHLPSGWWSQGDVTAIKENYAKG